jgi:WD40 repeat protein
MFISGCADVPHDNINGKIYLNDYKSIVQVTFNGAIVQKVIITCAIQNDIKGVSVSQGDTLITFCYDTWNGETMNYGLLLVNTNTYKIDTLITSKENEYVCPVFSPDNKTIALLIRGKRREYPIKNTPITLGACAARCLLLDIKTKSYKQITDSVLSVCQPCWDKDGASLYVSTYDGSIIQITREGKTLKHIVNGYAPSLSPNNEKIVCIDAVDENKINIYDLKTKSKKVLANRMSWFIPNSYEDVYFAWSPDSKYILYQGRNLLSYITRWSAQYVVIRADGKGSAKKIQNVTASGSGATWVP